VQAEGHIERVGEVGVGSKKGPHTQEEQDEEQQVQAWQGEQALMGSSSWHPVATSASGGQGLHCRRCSSRSTCLCARLQATDLVHYTNQLE
jgi:hypothetical protein